MKNWKLVIASALVFLGVASASTILRDASIVSSTINGSVIGGTTPAAAHFTTASASGGFTGNASTATALFAAGTNCGNTGGVAYGVDASGNALCSSSVVNRTCNSNGCYTVSADGTYTEDGTTSSASTGDVALTFPHAFPSTVVSITFGSDNTGSAGTRNVCYVSTALLTTGTTVSTDASTNNCHWHAMGY